jgi:hypothetical protein
MFYKLLGMLVWKTVRTYMRRKNGPKVVPAPVIAGAVVLVGVLVGLGLAKRDSD